MDPRIMKCAMCWDESQCNGRCGSGPTPDPLAEPPRTLDELRDQIKYKEAVDHPSHYNRGKIEVIDYLKETLTPEAYEGFLSGNVLKYVSRYPMKNGLEDLKKAQWYLERLIRNLEARPKEV